MIPVQEKPEPTDFESKVRAKGRNFLQQVTYPKNWDNREYWRNSLKDLYKAYNGVCAYSAQWIPETEGSPTVDHFIPKAFKPELAYEWSNFRLSCLKMNARKKDFQDVLDPFQIQYRWFTLKFPSLIIKPGLNLEPSIRSKVESTIQRLQLNKEETINSRFYWLMRYCENKFPFEFLQEVAPFIASELERQNLVDSIASIMSVS